MALYLIVSLAIGIILFFALRSVMLWYWKIDEIVSSLNELIEITKKAHKDAFPEELHKNTENKVIEGVVFMYPDTLSYNEIKVVEEKASQIKKGELVAIDHFTKRIEIWLVDEYYEAAKKRDMSICAARQS